MEILVLVVAPDHDEIRVEVGPYLADRAEVIAKALAAGICRRQSVIIAEFGDQLVRPIGAVLVCILDGQRSGSHLNTLVSPSLGRHSVGQWVTPRPSISAISVLLPVVDRGCTQTETDQRKRFQQERRCSPERARIKLRDEHHRSNKARARNIDDAGLRRRAVDSSERPQPLFSGIDG